MISENREKRHLLNWNARLKIAIGSAKGLAYLHHNCSPKIVHRNIKSSNILLDENLEPHVSDFGLAELLVDKDAHVTTVVAGTFGYLAPGVYYIPTLNFMFHPIFEAYLCISLLLIIHKGVQKLQINRIVCKYFGYTCG